MTKATDLKERRAYCILYKQRHIRTAQRPPFSVDGEGKKIFAYFQMHI